MNCPFCHLLIIATPFQYIPWLNYDNDYRLNYHCHCRQYQLTTDDDNQPVFEYYKLEKFVVMVSRLHMSTAIYQGSENLLRLNHLIWLNVKNTEETLTKLQMVITFS
jgi:hypothetical protein